MRRYKRRYARPNSRMITNDLIIEVVSAHPNADDALAYLALKSGANETQCIIALKRCLRRGILSYNPPLNRYKVLRFSEK